ncbi:MAG: NAD(P)H-quinone oxidoreductase [Vicinamibacterales bacterium]
MTAIEITAPGGPEALRPVQRAVPRPSDGEVLIRVDAAGVNRPDVLQRRGQYPPPPGASDIPGLEVAGTLVEVGGAVTRWQIGDRVCALIAGGGYAEYCVAPGPQCLPIPGNIGVVPAAAIPETFFTVWTNLFQRGALRPGERVLIHGGTSGIGTTAIQLAHVLGSVVFATAGSEHKCAACLRLGASAAINYRETDFVDVIRRETNGTGVDVILDIMGGEYFNRNLDCLAPDGRLVQIGLLGGATTTLDLGRVMRRRLTITGSTLRVRTVEEKGALARAVELNVWPLLAAGRVAPVIDRTFALADASAAHRRMEAGEHIGKLVLTTGGE